MAGPRPQRDGLRAAAVPRDAGRAGDGCSARCRSRCRRADSVLAMSRYDDPALARELGWDADAVVARGRALRRAEGRP